MKASIEEQRAQLMESEYIMCRGMIPPDELPVRGKFELGLR